MELILMGLCRKETIVSWLGLLFGQGGQGHGDRVGTPYLQISQLGELLATIL